MDDDSDTDLLPASPECITETIEIITNTIDEAFHSTSFYEKIRCEALPAVLSSTSSGYSTSSGLNASPSSPSGAPLEAWAGEMSETPKTPPKMLESPKTSLKVPESQKAAELPSNEDAAVATEASVQAALLEAETARAVDELMEGASTRSRDLPGFENPSFFPQATPVTAPPPPTEASTRATGVVNALEESIEDLLKPPETPEKSSSVGEYRFFCNCICCEERRYRRTVRKDRALMAEHLPKAKQYFENLKEKCGPEIAHAMGPGFTPALLTWEEEEAANSKIVPEEETEEGVEKIEGFLDEPVGGRSRESRPLVLARPPGYHRRREHLQIECTCEECGDTLTPGQQALATNWRKRVLQFRLRCNCFSCCLWRGCRAIGIVKKTQLPCRFIQTELYTLRGNDQMQHYLFGVCN